MKYRQASAADAAELLVIYAPYVMETAITFEHVLPTVEEFAVRIAQTAAAFPYLVAVDTDTGGVERIVGYAYASRYRERAAYDWVVELSVYVAREVRGQHVGAGLYKRLLAILRRLNFQRAYACITYPNPESVGFHEKLGFKEVGVFEDSGYKFGLWHSILWMELKLQEGSEVKPIRKIGELGEEMSNILEEVDDDS